MVDSLTDSLCYRVPNIFYKYLLIFQLGNSIFQTNLSMTLISVIYPVDENVIFLIKKLIIIVKTHIIYYIFNIFEFKPIVSN